MEIEEVTQSPVIVETEGQDNDLPDCDTINLEVTIEVENSSLKGVPIESPELILTQETNLDNGKKRIKEEKPPSKIVVRRLPPTMTKDQFLEQVSPLPDIDYLYYVLGDVNNNVNPFSRAYLNFVNQEDLFSFSRTFDNYVFLDSKGQEYPAVVEFSMFQRVPKQRSKKKDMLLGSIEADPSYITFKENLLAEALESSKSGGKTMKQHYFETEISTAEEVNTTPLLEFLKVRRAEKARIREERKEEKKRKELERKLKQKTKDKKGEGDEEDSSKDVKIQHKQCENHEMETLVDKNKQVSDKEKIAKYNMPIDSHNSSEPKSENISKKFCLGQKISILKSDKDNFEKSNPNFFSQNPTMGQLVQEAEAIKIKAAEQQTIYLRKLLGLLRTDSELSSNDNEVISPKDRRDNKERENRIGKRKDEKDNKPKETRIKEFKSRGGKSYQEERLKLAERREEQKKRDQLSCNEKKNKFTEQNDGTESVGGRSEQSHDGEKVIKIETRRYDRKSGKYENEDWKDDPKKRNRTNKKAINKRDGKERKDEYSRRYSDNKRNNESDPRRKTKTYKGSEASRADIRKINESESKSSESQDKGVEDSTSLETSKSRSFDDLRFLSCAVQKSVELPPIDDYKNKKRSSSLEFARSDNTSSIIETQKTILKRKEKNDLKRTENSNALRSRKDISNRRSYAESKGVSKKKDRSDGKVEDSKDGNSKSGDGVNSRDKENSKLRDAAARAERRIRNKDRPSIEIYRPGMGKFSKQRLEKEKALGSSTEIESPSHSPSPIPKSKLIS